jgi:hypothetical protein
MSSLYTTYSAPKYAGYDTGSSIPMYRCCDDVMTSSLKSCCGDDTSVLAENEALRRRIMELEVLGSRRLTEFPDELRVLQSENNHFRDLTYSRLAEVEYWKRLYQTERDSTQERLDALKKKYRTQFEQQVQRFKELNSLDIRFNQGTSIAFETQKNAWETESAAELTKYRAELINLEKSYREQLTKAEQLSPTELEAKQRLQAEIDELKLRLANLDVIFTEKLQAFKIKIAQVTKEEIAKVLQRDYEYMQLMNADLLSLQAALKQKDEEIKQQQLTSSEGGMHVIRLPEVAAPPLQWQHTSSLPIYQIPEQQQTQHRPACIGTTLHIGQEASAPLLSGQHTNLPTGLDLDVLKAMITNTNY